MKAKKIKYEDASYILNYKKKHLLEKWFCNCYILPTNKDNGCDIFCKIKLIYYLISFIPLHIIIFFSLIYDGGLKNFYILPREVYRWHYLNCSKPFNKIKELKLI